MEVVLVRHGTPDYSACIEKKRFGMGLNLAPLSQEGYAQAEEIAGNSIFKDAQLIVSSPYTRALETAAIISRKNDIELIIDEDIYEWVPDRQYLNTMEDEKKYSEDFLKHHGHWPENEEMRWESIDMLSNRVLHALNRYTKFQKIIVVCHAVVIYHLTGLNTVPPCCICKIDYFEDYKPLGWF